MWDFVQKIRRDAFEGAVIRARSITTGPPDTSPADDTPVGARLSPQTIPIRRYEMRIAAGLGAGFMLAGMDGVGGPPPYEKQSLNLPAHRNTILAKMRETPNEALDKAVRGERDPEDASRDLEHEVLRAQDAEAFANYRQTRRRKPARSRSDKNIETR